MSDYYTKIETTFDNLDLEKLKQLHCATVGPVDWYWTDVRYVLDQLKSPFWSKMRPNKIWFYEYDGIGMMPGFGQDKHHMCAVYHFVEPAGGINLFYDGPNSPTPTDKLEAKQGETWLVNLKARQTMYFPDSAVRQKRQYVGFMYEAFYETVKSSLL